MMKPTLSNKIIGKTPAGGFDRRLSKYWPGIRSFGYVSDRYVAPLSENNISAMESSQSKMVFFFEVYDPGGLDGRESFLKIAFAYRWISNDKVVWLIRSTEPIERALQQIYTKQNIFSGVTKTFGAILMPLAIPHIMDRYKKDRLKVPEIPSIEEMKSYIEKCSPRTR